MAVCVHVHHCYNSLRTEWCVAGKLSAPRKASSEDSVLSRCRLKQKESTSGERSNGRNNHHSFPLLKPLWCCDTRRAYGSDWVSHLFTASNNATQQQRTAITALPRPHLPLHRKETANLYWPSCEMRWRDVKRMTTPNKWWRPAPSVQSFGWIHMFHTNKSSPSTKQRNVIRHRNKRAALGAFLGEMTLVLVSFCTS